MSDAGTYHYASMENLADIFEHLILPNEQKDQ